MVKRLGFIGVSLILLGSLLWLVVGTSSPLEDLESTQHVTAEKYVNQGTDGFHVFVLYKPTCPVCKKYGKDISNALLKLDKEEYSVVNVSSGVPHYLDNYFEGFSFEGIHVPYVIISRGSEVLYAQSVDSLSKLKEFQSSIKELRGS